MSEKFYLVQYYYIHHLWNMSRVLMAVKKGWITQEEADLIFNASE